MGEGPLDVAAAVAPRPELLHDPRGEPGRGVGEPERGGLGLGAVHGDVGALGRGPGRAGLEPGTLLGREVRRVAGEDERSGVGAVDGRDPAGVVEPEVAASVAVDAPARRAEPRVAENAHELGPQAGHRDGVQGRAGGAVGVPVARHVGHHHVERVGGIRAEVQDYPGMPSRPFTWNDVVGKFDQLTADRIDSDLANEIKDAVRSLEHIKVRDLMTLLARIHVD